MATAAAKMVNEPYLPAILKPNAWWRKIDAICDDAPSKNPKNTLAAAL